MDPAAPDRTSSPQPICFVAMPFGRKPDPSGGTIDFDVLFADVIRPAIEAAGMDALRADEEAAGGIIHKPMFERLIFCEYAVADLTTGNPNVFYELGVRHAVRPYSTIVIASKTSRVPFDVSFLRAVLYDLTADGRPADAATARERVTAALGAARQAQVDSPLFQLVEGWRQPPIDRLKTDVFREQVQYSKDVKQRLAAARRDGVAAVRAVEQTLGRLEDAEAGVLVDLLVSYRAVNAWPEMIALVAAMAKPLAATTLVREQLAFALNRAGRADEAETVLQDVLAAHGPSSETYGLLGRIYKDRWEAARKAGDDLLARGLLRKAIDMYVKGFESDWRDAYPGVNAVTLMELSEPKDVRQRDLLPVVAYAVQRRIALGNADYWDLATRVELAVLAEDQDTAASMLADALATRPEHWQRETTARNLRLIREARERRGGDHGWIAAIERQLIA
jgi:hypothetical protein